MEIWNLPCPITNQHIYIESLEEANAVSKTSQSSGIVATFEEI
jgi:hypothetical protein